VIVAYRGRELLRACLESLRAHPPRRGEMLVHVVDNASGDGTAAMVAEEFPEVRLWPLERNAGFSFANNVALRETTAPYVLVLNPDTELREGVLDHLMDLLDREPDAGMAGCRLVRLDGTFDHAAKRSFPTPLAALAHFARIGGGDGAQGRLGQYRAPGVDEHSLGDVDAVNGAFMLVRREAMDEVGLFDEGYWLYMEDLDWCRRFHERGWRVLYDGRVTAVHVKGGTAGKRRAWRQNVAFHRGMGRFYRRYESGRRPIVDAAVYAGVVAKMAASVTANAVMSRLER
jgi:GT2 family glycosyltransferase